METLHVGTTSPLQEDGTASPLLLQDQDLERILELSSWTLKGRVVCKRWRNLYDTEPLYNENSSLFVSHRIKGWYDEDYPPNLPSFRWIGYMTQFIPHYMDCIHY